MPITVYNRPAPQFPRMIVDAEGGALLPTVVPDFRRLHVSTILVSLDYAKRFLPESVVKERAFKLWELDWRIVEGIPAHVALALDSKDRVVALVTNLK